MNLPTTAGSRSIADDRAPFHFQRGEERSRAVALAIMGHRGHAAVLQRQMSTVGSSCQVTEGGEPPFAVGANQECVISRSQH